MKVSSETLKVVRSIGLPGEIDPIHLSDDLYKTANLNKIPLFYLESRMNLSKSRSMDALHSNLRERFLKTIKYMVYLSNLFNKNKIKYVFFKTIKPFPYTPNDVDVLLETQEDVKRAFHSLRKEGHILVAKGMYSLTMANPYHEVKVDLQFETSVSNMVYSNKKSILSHVVEPRIRGEVVRTLDSSAEIVIVATHSIYKEHMFTLSDYYTLSVLLRKIDLDSLINLVKETRSQTAIYTTFKLVEAITREAFNDQLASLTHENGSLSLTKSVLKRFSNAKILDAFLSQNLEMPYKYSKALVAYFFSDKLFRDTNARSSLPIAIFNSATSFQLKMFLSHFSRKSY